MWVIETAGAALLRANHPGHNILDVLRQEHPEARILRAPKPCINEVNELLFAVVHEPGEQQEVQVPVLNENGEPALDDEGNPKLETQQVPGPSVARSAGNAFRLEGKTLLIHDPQGQEIARFPLEVVYDPAA